MLGMKRRNVLLGCVVISLCLAAPGVEAESKDTSGRLPCVARARAVAVDDAVHELQGRTRRQRQHSLFSAYETHTLELDLLCRPEAPSETRRAGRPQLTDGLPTALDDERLAAIENPVEKFRKIARRFGRCDGVGRPIFSGALAHQSIATRSRSTWRSNRSTSPCIVCRTTWNSRLSPLTFRSCAWSSSVWKEHSHCTSGPSSSGKALTKVLPGASPRATRTSVARRRVASTWSSRPFFAQ